MKKLKTQEKNIKNNRVCFNRGNTSIEQDFITKLNSIICINYSQMCKKFIADGKLDDYDIIISKEEVEATLHAWKGYDNIFQNMDSEIELCNCNDQCLLNVKDYYITRADMLYYNDIFDLYDIYEIELNTIKIVNGDYHISLSIISFNNILY